MGDFVELLEELKLATPHMTLEGVLSVGRYHRFHEAFYAAVTAAKNRLIEEGLLEGFDPPAGKQWQENHNRIGFLAWAQPSCGAFAFLGLYHGQETTDPGVPELYFFLEVPPNLKARRDLDAQATELRAILDRRSSQSDLIGWGFDEGGYETIWATESLVDIVREDDPTEATYAFFRSVIETLRQEGIMSRYFEALSSARE